MSEDRGKIGKRVLARKGLRIGGRTQGKGWRTG